MPSKDEIDVLNRVGIFNPRPETRDPRPETRDPRLRFRLDHYALTGLVAVSAVFSNTGRSVFGVANQ